MKTFYSQRVTLVVLVLFCFFMISDSYPVYSFGTKTGKKLIKEGEMLYEKGEYEKALETFKKAENLTKKKELLLKLYLNISLVNYALGNTSEVEEYLKKLFALSPGKKIPKKDYPKGYLNIFSKVKKEVADKIEAEKQAKMIEKTGEKRGKKKKKFPVLLVVGGIALAVALVALMGKKKDDGGSPEPQQPTKGSIQVNSTPDGADIWLNGSNTGQETNATLTNIDPGAHTIRLTKENYKDYETTVNVEAGSQATVSATLEMEFDISIGIEWIDIPEGEFIMGDNSGDSYEGPEHAVYLDAYKISKYEITFDQYDRFCVDTGRPQPNGEGWGRSNRPVINVSWYDARDFCNWLSQKTGKNISLPTEAQWEKAARGTDQRRYPWGNGAPTCSIVNYNNCQDRTMPVGSYPSGASPYGVHDMAGNVWEWCYDWYNNNYYSNSPYRNPMGPTNGTQRVRRGGAFDCEAWFIRATYRSDDPPSYSYKLIGFRIVQN